MRTRVLLPIFLLLHSLQLLAQQNPLIGAWQAVSFKGTASSGRKINAEGSFRETKIFSDTHYILITHIQKGDSLVFEKATAGTFRVEGNKYIETPQYASDPNILLEKNNFTYTLEEGHRFIQSGTYTTPDGKKGKLEELIFQKVKEDKVNSPLAGSWKHIQSSAYEDASGFEIETPTQWLGIYFKGKTFESATGGDYTLLHGNRALFNIKYSSIKAQEGAILDVAYQLQGDKVTYTGHITGKDGKKLKPVREVFQRVGTKTTTASTK